MSVCTSILCAAMCVAASAAAISKPNSTPGFTSPSGFTNKAAAQAWVDTEFVPNEKTVWGDNADFNSVYSNIANETDPPTCTWMIDDEQMSYEDVKARAAAIQQKITNYEFSCDVDTLESAFPSLEISMTCHTEMDFNVAILGPNPVVANSEGKFEFNAQGNLVRRELKSDPAGSNAIRAILDCVLSITAMCHQRRLLSSPGGGDAVGGDYVFKFGDVKIDTFDAILLGILSLITVLLMLVVYAVFGTVRKVAQIYDGSTSKTCEYSAVPKSDDEISS